MAERAVIWDMDGVIADTGPFHFMAWQKVFRQRGVEYTREDFALHFGQRNDIIIRDALGQDATVDTIESISREKEGAFRTFVAGKMKLFPGVIKLLRELREHGFRQSLGSSAPRENIQLITQVLGIGGYFPVVITGRDVTEGKPSPQVFLLAARRMAVAPRSCVVIEDAPAGVEAARRAGMRCVAVTNSQSAVTLRAASLVVNTLEKVSAADLEKLLL